MHLVAPQVDEAVLQPYLVRILLIARYLHRQHVGHGLHRHRLRLQLDAARGQLRVDRATLTRDHLAGDGDDALQPKPVNRIERRRAGGEHALRQPVMVAQIDEQQSAMVALAMHPAGQARGLAGIGGTERPTSMSTIGVHVGMSWGRLYNRHTSRPVPAKSTQRRLGSWVGLMQTYTRHLYISCNNVTI